MRIIDNKKIDLTNDEFLMYESICASYKQGKFLFTDLFETDEEGIIVYLKPPKKMFTMEVVCFLQNIMVHQHLRRIYKEHKEALSELNKEKEELIKLKEELKNR